MIVPANDLRKNDPPQIPIVQAAGRPASQQLPLVEDVQRSDIPQMIVFTDPSECYDTPNIYNLAPGYCQAPPAPWNSSFMAFMIFTDDSTSEFQINFWTNGRQATDTARAMLLRGGDVCLLVDALFVSCAECAGVPNATTNNAGDTCMDGSFAQLEVAWTISLPLPGSCVLTSYENQDQTCQLTPDSIRNFGTVGKCVANTDPWSQMEPWMLNVNRQTGAWGLNFYNVTDIECQQAPLYKRRAS